MPRQSLPPIMPGDGTGSLTPWGVPGSLIRSARPIPNPDNKNLFDGISFPSGMTSTDFSYDTGIDFGCGVPCSWPYCNDDTYELKHVASERSPAEFNPGFAYLPWLCDWKENTEGAELAREDMDNEALSRLMAGVGSQMAKTIWYGETCHGPTGNESFPSLSFPTAAVDLAETLTDSGDEDVGIFVLILGLLLQPSFFWECSGGMFPMMIHMNPALFQIYRLLRLAEQVGDTYVGPNGAIIVADPGYSVFNPVTGELQLSMYVSGPVEVAIGTPTVVRPDDSLRRNKYEVLAEVPFIYRFDPCCVFGVTATISDIGDAIASVTS